MFKKNTKPYSQTTSTVIDELDNFQKKLHTTSIEALVLMDIGVLPKDDATKQKALLTHELSHAIENILNGMIAQEAIDKMLGDEQEED
ncbi:hypothetical protein F6I35_0001370 [Streptococcus anginosus]|uniref:hypothetical protein n=1 Tax=Streptococcus anginosus TaxID=1328 RepID=UPI0012471991|nr:hypothetical protein [Streptococcus anginosus]WOT14436.1 hypothetical protein F6I35_0001370 [Streptococcus anginosus]